MGAMIVETRASGTVKCAGCEERIYRDEKLLIVQSGGKPRKGEKYCPHCREIAEMNNDDLMFKIDGDERWYINTKDGPRCGYEHTGIACEDAPACGCCEVIEFDFI